MTRPITHFYTSKPTHSRPCKCYAYLLSCQFLIAKPNTKHQDIWPNANLIKSHNTTFFFLCRIYVWVPQMPDNKRPTQSSVSSCNFVAFSTHTHEHHTFKSDKANCPLLQYEPDAFASAYVPRVHSKYIHTYQFIQSSQTNPCKSVIWLRQTSPTKTVPELIGPQPKSIQIFTLTNL